MTSPALTGMGVILGTAAYMSPEQARGKAADPRADIWAFGCVVYEVVTGKRAFEPSTGSGSRRASVLRGDVEDVSDTLAAVLRAEPEWSVVPERVVRLYPRVPAEGSKAAPTGHR